MLKNPVARVPGVAPRDRFFQRRPSGNGSFAEAEPAPSPQDFPFRRVSLQPWLTIRDAMATFELGAWVWVPDEARCPP